MHDAPPTGARRASDRRLPLIADVVSYGYAALVIAIVLTQDLVLGMPAAVGIMIFFVILRAMAREIRRNVQRAARTASR